jgi:hypothetical protein
MRAGEKNDEFGKEVFVIGQSKGIWEAKNSTKGRLAAIPSIKGKAGHGEWDIGCVK